MTDAQEIIDLMTSMRDPVQSGVLSRFFKTGYGEYGYGDKFLGIRCPQTRSVVKAAGREIGLEEVQKLLASEWHEIRLCGFLLLVEQMQVCLGKGSGFLCAPRPGGRSWRTSTWLTLIRPTTGILWI